MRDASCLTDYMTDREIIDLYLSGSQEAAFNQIVNTYTERLYWHIRRFLCSHEDSNDLLQEIFIKVWAALPSFRRDAQLYTWMYRIATNEVLKDGWLFTGDMAKEDEEGFIFLVDRKKDVIISGGENLYPVQIEDFLRMHPAVKDVAVIGLPDERLGEIAAAIIEVKEGMECTEEEINEFCLGMPRYKRPRKIIFADIPRNPTGKIEKPKLREIYCGVRLVEAETTK